MQKALLRATALVLAVSAAFQPARSADLANSPVPPAAPSPAYSLNLLYTGELWDVATGGLRRGTSYMDNVDARFQVDMGKAVGWTGGTFVAEGFYANAMSTQFYRRGRRTQSDRHRSRRSTSARVSTLL